MHPGDRIGIFGVELRHISNCNGLASGMGFSISVGHSHPKNLPCT